MSDNKKHVIWSYDSEYLREEMKQAYPDKTEDEITEIIESVNGDYLDDERVNLDIQLNTEIIIIADLGLWNGRRNGYKIINSGNIADCLYTHANGFPIWYLDEKGDLCCNEVHHDGTNHYRYRAFRENTSYEQRENLKDAIYDGTVTESTIKRVTRRLGDYIANVYGWKIRGGIHT